MTNNFNVSYRASDDSGLTHVDISMNWETKGVASESDIDHITYNLNVWLTAMGLNLQVTEKPKV